MTDDIAMAAELGDVERAIALLPVSSPLDVVQAFDWFVDEGEMAQVLLDAGANPNQGYLGSPLRSPPWWSEKTPPSSST